MFLWDVLDAMPAGVTVTEAELPLRPALKSLRGLFKRIRESSQNVDVVHAQFGSLVGLAAAFSRKPLVLSLRGTDFYVLPARTFRARVEARIRQLASLIACFRADLVIVMSDRMKRELRRWPLLRRKRIIVMIDPIGEEFLTNETERAASRSFAMTTPFDIFVGSLAASNPVKRTWLVERAVEICRDVGIPVNLKVISGLPREGVKEAMAASDLVALTSTHEGWPNVIKEGQALGLPFIATDVSDLSGLCLPGSPNKIVEADELDIALAIVDAIALRDVGGPRASILPAVVSKKHQLIYRYFGR
jgi:glycosyltransferase involved in cell wall biosynthesis